MIQVCIFLTVNLNRRQLAHFPTRVSTTLCIFSPVLSAALPSNSKFDSLGCILSWACSWTPWERWIFVVLERKLRDSIAVYGHYVVAAQVCLLLACLTQKLGLTWKYFASSMDPYLAPICIWHFDYFHSPHARELVYAGISWCSYGYPLCDCIIRNSK